MTAGAPDEAKQHDGGSEIGPVGNGFRFRPRARGRQRAASVEARGPPAPDEAGRRRGGVLARSGR